MREQTKNTLSGIFLVLLLSIPMIFSFFKLKREVTHLVGVDWFVYASVAIPALIFLMIYIVIVNKIGKLALFSRFEAVMLFLLLSISWMVTYIFGFAATYKNIGILSDGKIIQDTASCLYFSIVTWTTLGYGDLQPTSGGRLIAGFQALFGYIYLGLFVGFLINISSKHDS